VPLPRQAVRPGRPYAVTQAVAARLGAAPLVVGGADGAVVVERDPLGDVGAHGEQGVGVPDGHVFGLEDEPQVWPGGSDRRAGHWDTPSWKASARPHSSAPGRALPARSASVQATRMT